MNEMINVVWDLKLYCNDNLSAFTKGRFTVPSDYKMNGILFREKSVNFYQSTVGQVSKRQLRTFVVIEVRPD
jgi:hypothetical protein